MNFTVFGFIFMLNLNLCSVIVYMLSRLRLHFDRCSLI